MGMEYSFQYRRQRHLTYKVTFERRLERSEDTSLGYCGKASWVQREAVKILK